MQEILNGLLSQEGVYGAVVFEESGDVLGALGSSIYDNELLSDVASDLSQSIDALQLVNPFWEMVEVQFDEGYVFLRLVSEPGGEEARKVLAVIAHTDVNKSFASVAARVTAQKIKKRLASSGGALTLERTNASMSGVIPQGNFNGNTQNHSLDPIPDPSMSGSWAQSQVSQAANLSMSGSWVTSTSQAGQAAGGNPKKPPITVADAPSKAYLERSVKNLARYVGPMAKVFVKDAVRNICFDRPFSANDFQPLTIALAERIDGQASRSEFVELQLGRAK